MDRVQFKSGGTDRWFIREEDGIITCKDAPDETATIIDVDGAQVLRDNPMSREEKIDAEDKSIKLLNLITRMKNANTNQ